MSRCARGADSVPLGRPDAYRHRLQVAGFLCSLFCVGCASPTGRDAGADASRGPAELSAVGDRAYEVSAAWIGDRPALSWYGGRLAREALFLRYTDLWGRPDGPVLQLTDARRDAYEPSLQDFRGEPLVAWYEQDTARHQVALLALFDHDGNPRWLRELSAPAVDGRNPVVRVAGDSIHVAWIEHPEGRQGAAEPVLRVGVLDAQGQWLEPARTAGRVSRTTWNLNAALHPDGTFEVVYDSDHDTRAKELHSVRVRAGTVHQALLSEDDGHDSVYPDLALERGRRALTWFDYRDGNAEVYLRCGEREARRVTDSPGESIGAYLTWQAGRLHLAWIDAVDGMEALLVQEFDGECRPRGPQPVRLSAPDGVAGIPSWAQSHRGLALGWNERRGSEADLKRHGHNQGISSVALFHIWNSDSTH